MFLQRSTPSEFKPWAFSLCEAVTLKATQNCTSLTRSRDSAIPNLGLPFWTSAYFFTCPLIYSIKGTEGRGTGVYRGWPGLVIVYSISHILLRHVWILVRRLQASPLLDPSYVVINPAWLAHSLPRGPKRPVSRQAFALLLSLWRPLLPVTGGWSWEWRPEASWQSREMCLEALQLVCQWKKKAFVKLSLAERKASAKTENNNDSFLQWHSCHSVCTRLISSSLHDTLRIRQGGGHLKKPEADEAECSSKAVWLEDVEPGTQTQTQSTFLAILSLEKFLLPHVSRKVTSTNSSLSTGEIIWTWMAFLYSFNHKHPFFFKCWHRCTLVLSFVI